MQNNLERIISFIRTRRLFVCVVILPTVLAALYFGLIASDIYISESQFVVRSPEGQTATPLGFLFKGSGFNRAQDDSYTVQKLIVSRDALHQLDKSMNIRKIFQKGDIFSSFASFGIYNSFEDLYLYYQNRVLTAIEADSSIITLSVRSFDAQDSQKINQRLLEMSEELVNRLNERGRKDMIRFAAQEVADAEEKAKKVALLLAEYGVVNPAQESAIKLQQIAKLQDELITVNANLIQLQTLAKENPQIPVLQKRAQVIEANIDKILKGLGQNASVSDSADFQRLVLENDFARNRLASALASLENARNEAQRQHFYLERIAQPSLPDEAMEPRRLRGIAVVFVVGLIFWGVLSMLIAGIREHLD